MSSGRKPSPSLALISGVTAQPVAAPLLALLHPTGPTTPDSLLNVGDLTPLPKPYAGSRYLPEKM